jgi:hypothetical protein
MKRSQSKPEVSSITSMATTSTSSSDKDIILKTKIQNATEGLPYTCLNYLCIRILPALRGKENVLTICEYISSMKSEVNIQTLDQIDTL